MNVTRPITSTEIENVIKTRPTNKSPVTDGFTGESYQTFRKALAPTLLKCFQKKKKKLQRKEHSQVHSTKPPLPRYQNQTKISYQKITGQYH